VFGVFSAGAPTRLDHLASATKGSPHRPWGRPMTSILAIILTYDSPADLEACVAAVGAQTAPPAALLVVDNASAPPAAVPGQIGGIPVTVQREAFNSGPAGGHAAGLAWFAERDFDAAWVLDDDMIPEPGCLAAQAEAMFGPGQDGRCLAYPAIIEQGATRPRWFPSWCGVLIPAAAVAAAGGPRADFFWWAEDSEYLQWRLPRAGFAGRKVPTAQVHHRRTRAARGRPPWKVYYEARNSVYYRLRVQEVSRHSVTRTIQIEGRLLLQVVFREPDKLTKLWLFTRGLIDGLRGRLGITVPVS